MAGNPGGRDGAPGTGAEDLRAQNAYYQKRLDELTGQTIKSDTVISRSTRELRQRRQALSLLSELHRTITTDLSKAEIFRRVLEATQRALKMDRSVVLEPGDDGAWHASASVGFDSATGESLAAQAIDTVDVAPDGSVLANKAATLTPLIAQVRERLGMPFFVAVPVVVGDKVEALLLSGRQRELKPFFPALDEQDVYTFSSLAGFLGAALTNAGLFAHQKRMAQSFERFVPKQFLEFLSRTSIVDVKLGDQTQRTMSVLFSDIRSFTTISEKMTPKENFDFINRYLEFVAPVVLENGGFIDKYIGDAIMALFPGDAATGVRAAVGLHTALHRFNAEWTAAGYKELAIGAGVHTGALMLGTIGFRERIDTTVIADAVNLAARMEGLTKQYGAGVLITGATLAAAGDAQQFGHRTVDRVLVKGKHEPIEIIEVFDGDEPGLREHKRRTLAAFEAALALYTKGDFAAARAGFASVLAAHAGDGGAALLVKRCERFMTPGAAPSDWRGVVAMEK